MLSAPLIGEPRREAATSPSDDALLARFVAHGDEAAFRELVQRHGPMVLDVCRRVLGAAHDAEDAFQATFIVLVRKAGTLTQPQRLANWLYGVAYRVAVKARGQAQRRLAVEQHIPPTIALEAPPDVELRDARAVLDEEINRLPEKLRAPIVLCYLQGLTNGEAARKLGWPAGTISGRLREGREQLHQRLTRRGINLSVALLVLLLWRNRAAAVAPQLAEDTVKLAMNVARGDTPAHVSVALADASLEESPAVHRWHSRWLVALVMALIVGAGASALGLTFGESSRRRPDRGNHATSHGTCSPRTLGATVEPPPDKP